MPRRRELAGQLALVDVEPEWRRPSNVLAHIPRWSDYTAQKRRRCDDCWSDWWETRTGTIRQARRRLVVLPLDVDLYLCHHHAAERGDSAT